MQFYCPQKMHFLLHFWTPFLTMKILKHCCKWPTPLEWYGQDSLLSLVWGCKHILILALDFFHHRLWHSGHMVPISCKTSYSEKTAWTSIMSWCKQDTSSKFLTYKGENGTSYFDNMIKSKLTNLKWKY